MQASSTWKSDLYSGFLVFLIALPLCLGISMASGFPPISGILTAIVGGMVVSLLGSARLTIKGPAAGLIVIAIGAVTELGYKRALAVVVVAGVIQIVLALTKAGVLGDLMPSAVVHGMLAAIGVIIISKQAHTVLGVTPEGKEPLHLLAEIPHSVANVNPEVFLIGALALLILFTLPLIRISWVRQIPAPMLVLAAAVPMGVYFDLSHTHLYRFSSHTYEVGPNFLIRLPGSLLSALSFPDFSAVLSAASIKYIVMFALVGTIESLLSVIAVDSLDPERRVSDLNRDLLATGVGNTVAGLIGGLPMISEIVRSKANIDNGAKSHWANFFHGTFLLLSIVLIPGLLQQIPMAALAAMLIYTGTRLASPKEFMHVYKIGPEQLLLFVVTMMVTLATDLLVGVGAGLVLKVILHMKNGVPFRSLFRSVVSETQEEDRLILKVQDAAIFTNYLGLKRRLANVPPRTQTVILDFEDTWVVDHTVLAKLEKLSRDWTQGRLVLTGLDGHAPASAHDLASRRKLRSVGVAQGA
ncbi:MAG: SulP family inorganic anion transporter [Bryobacterales bacterium]|nr:SulP family inorganic anion transporter [Bryobacterales bacterium]